ncbi:5'/3'-nucleotidase SurE [Cellulomonas cellasea]|uniref:5'-nucleotidase n=2 Tax=Cellulomonas cellasea TaxID=43670 RepID=A0A0A0B592_9CELL|nr:5'/3'-nucleotidase SurE [Cellulomonas cellasea]KGM01990.1 Survival protein SurE [Cellulomonas cellasea DSM 20118]GEA90093.1 5'/3'-nucleotidase SurE [Cellulomonas cellasea]
MRALVTNDDGISSPGLAVLVAVARDAGYDVTVAAPAAEASGSGTSLVGVEHGGRLRVERRTAPGVDGDVPSFAVHATPALIAFLAAYEGFGPRPDVVLSGVNRGANTGHAVLHSGTVGAALSAMTLGIHGLAVSLDSPDPRHWATAGVVAARGLRWLVGRDAGDGVLNVNVPDRPADALRGVRAATLAPFGAVQASVRADDAGDLVVRYRATDDEAAAGSDAGLLADGWATLTLLRAPCADAAVELPEVLDGPLAAPDGS